MRKIFALLFFLTFCVAAMSGQSYGRQATPEEKRIIRDMEGSFISSHKQPNAESLIRLDDSAYAVYRKGNGLCSVGNVFAYIGGFGVGWWLGSTLFGGSSRTPETKKGANIMLGVGLGGIAVSAAFVSVGVGKHKKAVELYNNNLSNQLDNYKKSRNIAQLGITSSGGIGFELTF